MGLKVTNNAFGTLNAGINDSATSIVLTAGQGSRFPTLSAGDYFYATLIDTSNNLEIVKVTARSTDTMTVVRGQDNTTARAYSTNDRFELRPTAALFNEKANDADVAAGYVAKSGSTMTGNLSVVVNDTDLKSVSTFTGSNSVYNPAASGTPAKIVSAVDLGWYSESWRMGATRGEGSDIQELMFVRNASSTSTKYLGIDSAGRVTMPFQPAISIGINQSQITDSNGTNLFGVSGRAYLVDTAVGITHNTTNGRFTVPVAGRYLISFYSMKEGTGIAYLDINVNDVSWLRPYSTTNAGGWTAYSVCAIRSLAAGDYITPKVTQNGTMAVAHGLEHMRLVMQLIG
jgi:hypothetical protein